MFQGLRTTIYHVPDLARAKAWYSTAFNTTPYFDERFYVGFSIGGYELGLNPDMDGVTIGNSSVAYWGVPRIDDAVRHMLACGARLRAPVKDVGEGIKVATVTDPFENVIGLIENPHFKADALSVDVQR